MSPPTGRCQSDAPGRAFSRTIALEGGDTVGEAGVLAPQSSTTLAAAAKSRSTTSRPLYSAGGARGRDASEPDAHSASLATATFAVPLRGRSGTRRSRQPAVGVRTTTGISRLVFVWYAS